MATAKFQILSRDQNEERDSRTISNVNPTLMQGGSETTVANMSNIQDGFNAVYTTLTNNTLEQINYIVTYDVAEEAE